MRAASTIVVLVPLDGRRGSRLDRRPPPAPVPHRHVLHETCPRAGKQSFLLNIVSIVRE
jgi:hypothetical protein